MSKIHKIKLKLGGTRPDELPQAKLVQYLAALTKMCGESDVHFSSVEEGSAELISYTKCQSTYGSVIANINASIASESKDYRDIAKYLARDNYTAQILSEDNIVIGSITPHIEPKPIAITKKTKVQGQLYNIGGRDETIPVKLLGANNEILNCEANQQTATQLAKYLFKKIRVHGVGDWENINGIWKLKKLKIEKFELLKDISIKQALSILKEDENNKWDEMEDREDILHKVRSIN
ncbi:hypothetical protein [Morganella morganii]|uniref:hypothetical protein n=1 Tax=Morganella morganii TaxID=582 RepID=UPI001BDB7E7F|nr:hypothetical protein [Morganella morganii]MBT0442276.1 hypothetical protein [Morganella morganii subsp. morganii]